MQKTIKVIAEGGADTRAITELVRIYNAKNELSCQVVQIEPRHRGIAKLLINIKKEKVYDLLVFVVDKDNNSSDDVSNAKEWEQSNKDKHLLVFSDPCLEIWLHCLHQKNIDCNKTPMCTYNKAHCKSVSKCSDCLKEKIDMHGFRYNKNTINKAVEFQQKNNLIDEPKPFTQFNKLIDTLKDMNNYY